MYNIIFFSKDKEAEWDEFIFKDDTINGTFLQSRRFLNYHREGKFTDCSLMIYKQNKLVAICPACEVYANEKTFISHQGSTYGGFIISKSLSRLELAYSLVEETEKFIYLNGFTKIIMKPTMQILCKESDEVVNYALNQHGYNEYKELNLYIDYDYVGSDIISNFSKLKRRQVKRCIELGMGVRELNDKSDIATFHEVLTENLRKYNTLPVHTVEELIDLKENRFPDYIHIYGVYYNSEIVAGTMVFEFPHCLCAHTQYLASKVLDDISPMSYVYYSMIEIYKRKGYRFLSWGIATEHYGINVNWGLMRNKEEFGSSHCLNLIYEKSLI